MKILIIGGTGQLGQDLLIALSEHDVYSAARRNAQITIDLAQPDSTTEALDRLEPDVVINTAAAHNVPACEENPAEAYAVNATGVARLAEACSESKSRLIHISTDYVFGHFPAGVTPRPWREIDLPSPLNAYASSKLAGEHLLAAACANHIILRTSGLYGVNPCLAKGGQNFVQLMLRLASERDEVKVVTDEILTPTPTADLALQIKELVENSNARGVFHATCHGQCSWNEFARAIFDYTKSDVRLLPATQEDFPSPVRRPDYSVLDNARLRELGLDVMPDWRQALESYLEKIALEVP